MKARLNRLRRGEQGQALVELALVLPILLVLIFGVIDFGIAINQYNDTTNLANIGARAVSVASSSSTEPTCSGETGSNLTAYMQCLGKQDNSNLANAVICPYDGNSLITSSTSMSAGDTLAVDVITSYSWLKLFSPEVGSALSTQISSAAFMRGEQTNSTAPSWITNGESTSSCPATP